MSDAAATAESRPTRWDLSNVYSGLEADDYRTGCADLVRALDTLEAFFDEHGVRRTESPATTVTPGITQLVADLLTHTNDVIRRYSTLRAFVFSFFSTDSYNAVAQREISKLEKLGVRFNKLSVRLEAFIGSHASLIDDLLETSEIAKEHEFTLRWSAKQSQYLMSEELEALASELVVDGGSAFGKLQGVLTSQLKLEFDSGNGKKSTPVTVIQNHRFSADGLLRKRAYEAELKAWDGVKAAIAASLNAVKGTAITLAKRRGRESVLDTALDRNKIDRATLDAMMGAIEEHFPTFRRYLTAKAKKLRKSRLSWWDIQAPVGGDELTFTWTSARDFIVRKFGTFSDELGEYAATAFDEKWIDGEPREGKRGGAFCMPVVGVDESRILVNFDGSFDQ